MQQVSNSQFTPQKVNKNRLLTFNETFDSAINQKQQKFSLDKTLVQGIKDNDPSKIVQNSQDADLGNVNEIYNQEKQITDIFVNTRKKYDQTKLVSNRIQDNIEKLKKQRAVLQNQKAKIQSTFNSEEKQFMNIKQQLNQMNQMYQSVKYAKDCRLSMSQILKKDILFYKKACFEANIKIVRNHNKLKSVTNQFENTKKLSSTCKGLIQSVDKNVSSKQTQRYEKLNSYHDVINRKLANSQRRDDRQRRIQNSMSQALNGLMHQQVELRKLFHVNSMVKKMLKMKMIRQMKRYQETQGIFRKIKQNSTVKSAQQFVQKFVNRQKIYGQLLQSISKCQEKTSFLKEENKQLLKINQQLLNTKSDIEDEQNSKTEKLTTLQNANMDLIREKLLKNQSLKNKTYSWATKFLSTFDGKDIDQVKRKLSKQQITKLFQQSLSRINKFLDNLKQEENPQARLNQIYVEAKYLQIPNKFRTKNTRIKTISTRQGDVQQIFQDHDVAYDDYAEKDFLNQNRRQIKKSNYLRNRIKTRAY